MRKNLSDNFKSSIIYILIPVILVGVVLFMSSQNKSPDVKYSEIVNLFTTEQVSEYEIDLSSGALKYKLFKDDEDTDGRGSCDGSLCDPDVTVSGSLLQSRQTHSFRRSSEENRAEFQIQIRDSRRRRIDRR